MSSRIGNGHDSSGRFTAGNAGGPGNPYGKEVARFRRAIIAAVSEDDICAVVQALVREAKKGNVKAAEVLLQRLAGRPVELEVSHQQNIEDDRRSSFGLDLADLHRMM
jgi:hypothetical protein